MKNAKFNLEKFMRDRSKFIWEKTNVVYPKSSEFIRDLPPNAVAKFKEFGWNVPRTIFLEMPYVFTEGVTLTPSTCCIFLIPIFEEDSYFRALIFTKGYVESFSDIEIEDSVLHEQIELEKLEKFCKECVRADLEKRFSTSPSSSEDISSKIMEYSMNETEIFNYTVAALAKKYGYDKEKIIDELLNKADHLKHDMRKKLGVILPWTLELWAWKYFKQNFSKYMHEALPIFPAFKEARESYETRMEKIEHECLASPNIVEERGRRPVIFIR